jgi:hypothetical protein
VKKELKKINYFGIEKNISKNKKVNFVLHILNKNNFLLFHLAHQEVPHATLLPRAKL